MYTHTHPFVTSNQHKKEIKMKTVNTTISIPAFQAIDKGALSKIGTYLKNSDITKVSIFFGNGLIDLFGNTVMNSLKDNDIEVLEYLELDSVNLTDITSLAFSMPNKTQAIIGIGGGKVIDAAKYSSFLRKIPFISVPTSASSDGFSSASASLLIDGKRQSVPAKMAYGIIIDIDAIKSAPVGFLYSGIGDMVAKITSLYDWEYEEKMGCCEVNDVAMMVAKKAVDSFIQTPFETITDDVFLKELLDSLAMSGIANEIAGGSLPTSGSEHLISHALDKYASTPSLHGIQVGIATYLMSLVQEHSSDVIYDIFTKTGFFDYVATLGLDINDYLNAIDQAPGIKPFRHTYLHEEKYRAKAKEILVNNEVFKKIF